MFATASWAAGGRPAAAPYPGEPSVGEPVPIDVDLDLLLRLGSGTGVQAAADFVIGKQCDDGGWGWPLDCPPTYHNITAPIAMGLLRAYDVSGDVDTLVAAIKGGDFDLTGVFNDSGDTAFGSFTPAFFYILSDVLGDSTYSDNAAEDFFDKLTAGTYGDPDDDPTYYPADTYGYLDRHKAIRSGYTINLRPWDMQYMPWVAGLIGNPDSSPADGVSQQDTFLQAVLDGLGTLDDTDPDNVPWDIIGLAGGVRGLALNGTSSFPAIVAPNHAINGIDNLCDLADALAAYQNANGSWYWSSNLSAPGASDEDTQNTAYAVMALIAAQEAGCGPYDTEIDKAREWLWTMQDSADGGFFSYPGGTKNIEVCGEVVAASTPVAEVALETDPCNVPGGTLAVDINVAVEAGQYVRGGQFFMKYDNSVLTFDSAQPYGDGGFQTEYLDVNAGAGTIDYFVSVVGNGEVLEPTKMATLIFTIADGDDLCETADLVEFRPHLPPSRLADGEGEPILLTSLDLEPVMIDSTAPVITTHPSDLSVNADAGVCTARVNFGTQTETFDNEPPLSGAQAAGYWYVDRYEPAGFTKADFDGDMRLKHSISSFDFQGEGSFYNTQGRKYDMNLATGATIAIDLYIPADWGTTVRRADLWATTFDADETISGYPIVGYASYDPADPENPDATPDPRFQFWTNDLNQDGVPDDAGWVDLGLPSDFAYDTWYTLEIELTQTSYVARVISSGDELTVTDIGIGGSVKFGNIIVQAKNYGESYDVYWDNCALPLVATDDCGGPVVVTYERGDNPALTLADPFPGGDTLVTWTAADGCGNEDTWVQTVTVSAFNELVVDVELSPTVVYGPFTRCITFELWDCGTNDSIMVQKTISFENGLGSATLDDVPCGVYDCITARDTLHTLRRTDSDDFGIVGTQYVADFTDEEGDDDRLVGGNLNDDEWIDILDYAILAWQYGENYGSGDTDCDTPYPHADINGDGVVDTADFTFIQTQYLEENEDNCCGMPGYPFIEGPVPDAQSAGPVTRISVHELKRRGLGHLAVGDLNGDGWLDEVDIVLFMNGLRP